MSDIHTVEIIVSVPEGTDTVYVTGNLDIWGQWNPRLMALKGNGPTRLATFSVPHGFALEMKFTLGAWSQEALDENGNIAENLCATITQNTRIDHAIPKFKAGIDELMATLDQAGIVGRLELLRSVESREPIEPRHVLVWLPPGYDESDARLPVLYMHDGQNIFDPRMSTFGVDWGVDECLARMIAAGEIEPMIVVGAFSTDQRYPEYTPWRRGPNYLRFLVEELKPLIDARYRTRPDRESTAIMGSSMGGLISCAAGRFYPHVFSRAGCLSTHWIWEDGRGSADFEASGPYPREVKLYLDRGTVGPKHDAIYGPHQDRVDALLREWGWREGVDFMTRVFDGADHSETAWRTRLDVPMRFLFGKG